MLSNWQTTMLLDDTDHVGYTSDDAPSNIPSKPYNDPVLFASQESYASFLARLDAVGMLSWKNTKTNKVDGALGIFFVKKKDGSLRIIFDI